MTRLHHKIPGSQFAVFERSGHMPFSEEPDAFLRTLEQFLTTKRWRLTPIHMHVARGFQPSVLARLKGSPYVRWRSYTQMKRALA